MITPYPIANSRNKLWVWKTSKSYFSANKIGNIAAPQPKRGLWVINSIALFQINILEILVGLFTKEENPSMYSSGINLFINNWFWEINFGKFNKAKGIRKKIVINGIIK